MSYIDSYYARTLTDPTMRPALTQTIECDTCVIGGGLAGLTAALVLSRAGQSVVVLEAKAVGWGASGRNGGFCAPGYAVGQESIVQMAGAEIAHRLHEISIEGMRFVRNSIDELAIAGVDPVHGITAVVRYDAEAGLRAKVERQAAEFKYELKFLDREAVQSVLHSQRYFQAIRDEQAFHMHALNYARGLAQEIERLGGRIFEESYVQDMALDIPTKVVGTAKGAVAAKNVLVTTGGYTGHMVPALKRAMLPIATYVMLSKEQPELIATAIGTTDGVVDDRRGGDYYRAVDGGRRLLWGGRITTRAASSGQLAAQLRAQMIATYPQLKSLELETAWSGLMSYARHQMPQIGQLQANVYYCTAFGGHGLNTTAIGGNVIAEAILGTSDRYRLFEKFGLDWVGGSLGLAAAQLIYWKLQAMDWWRERAA